MNEDFENLLKLFNFALSSDNPAVKKALKNLLLVVSVVEPQEATPNKGPLHDLMRELQDLKMQVAMLKSELSVMRQTPNTTYPTYPAYPPYPGIYTGTPWVTTGTVTSSSTSSSTLTAEQLEKLMETKLKKFTYTSDPLDDK